MKTSVLGAIALSTVLFAGAARAQTLGETPVASAAFGGAGQVAIAGDFDINFHHRNERSQFTLAPAIDYFIIPQLSVGGQIAFTYEGGDNDSTTIFGIGPRVGYNVPLAPMFSIYPRAGLAYSHVTNSVSIGQVERSASANFLSLFLSVPFLFHPVPHFFIGIGPALSGEVAGGEESQRHLTIALETTVGGWFAW